MQNFANGPSPVSSIWTTSSKSGHSLKQTCILLWILRFVSESWLSLPLLKVNVSWRIWTNHSSFPTLITAKSEAAAGYAIPQPKLWNLSTGSNWPHTVHDCVMRLFEDGFYSCEVLSVTGESADNTFISPANKPNVHWVWPSKRSIQILDRNSILKVDPILLIEMEYKLGTGKIVIFEMLNVESNVLCLF